jgi:hypothetical protein
MGIAQRVQDMSFSSLYLGLVLLFLAVSFVGRWKQMQG